jgi:hypothetical protein
MLSLKQMSLPFFLHTLYLIAAVILAFYWTKNPSLSSLSLQLTAALILVYFLQGFWRRKKLPEKPDTTYLNITNSIIFTLIVLLLVLSTQGLSSPLFFLLYFLLFGLSLFFHPWMSFLLTLALLFFFLLTAPPQSINQLLNLISLLLIAPLAHLFGTQYLRVLEAQNKIKVLEHQSKNLVHTISREETTSLMWLSLEFRNKMHQAIDLVSQLLANIAHIPYYQREQLDQLYQDLKALYQSGQELEEKIDKMTDEK